MNPLDAARQAIADVLSPAHFYAAPPAQLQWEHLSAEETPWELVRGQLVPRHLSRHLHIFESWNIFVSQNGQRSAEPVLSRKLDAASGLVHVVRGLDCWTWEGYHAGDNVYLSRAVPRWLRELVGTQKKALSLEPKELRAELALWVFRAVVGLSRLPLTSVEAPLPGFSLGTVAYFFNPDRCQGWAGEEQRPLTNWRQLPALYWYDLGPEIRARWLEFLLRSVPPAEVADAAVAWVAIARDQNQAAAGGLALLRAVFNDTALSPYTDFVDKTLVFLRQLVEQKYFALAQHVDFLCWLLCRLARHLTAYDLFTFHHRGANYPDALLLDAALKELLRLVEEDPSLFAGDDREACLRRRALRLAWLHRRRYEGHPVPDAPTSPGENMRVLPPPHVRVPEEQILNPARRRKRLYAGDPLANHAGPQAQRVLHECGRDLQRETELRELGMAVFIERPLAGAKAPGEPDLSPLLAHQAQSQSLAERALLELAREPQLGLSADDVARYREVLARPWSVGGIQARTLSMDLPRIVSLADAVKAASDFVILRTLPKCVRRFCELSSVAGLLQAGGINIGDNESWLIVANATAAGKPGVLIRDALGQQALQLEVDPLLPS
jgi:hypothetical protein